mgnify:CR=1 FL=1
MIRRPSRLAAALLIGGLALPAAAGTLVELAADASRPAANDLAKAVLFAEAAGANPGELARRVNGEIAEGLRLGKSFPGVAVKTGNVSSYPVYGKGRGIESWRMRAELLVESRDPQAMADLVGRLQARLALAGMVQTPADETRLRVEEETTRDALKAFQARAAIIAQALGKSYRIKQISVGQSGGVQPMPMLRGKMAMAAEAAPLPLEPGESPVTVTVSGQIELAD